MSSLEPLSGAKEPPLLIHRLQRLFIAACIILGLFTPLIAAVSNPPYFSAQGGVVAAITSNAADSDLMDQTHIIAEVIGAYTLPLAFLAIAWLAMRRAPWLASIAAVISLLGTLPIAVFTGEDSLYYDIARMGSSPQIIEMAQRFNGDWVMTFYNTMFALSTVLGPVFLGLALWRARVIPRWAAAIFGLSRLPAILLYAVVPYHVLSIIVIIGFGLLFVGGIPAALAILKEKDKVGAPNLSPTT
ncbi:hypothetical protein [Dictyobacter kobayashii]|uniref:DUF4386 domain-containing protein n=1 Tax=Dictyobacter kobayashii TaxID=2014872 RepID=A0A402AYL3_9CHLR|nr:hypothetical protein [Dictyobacter kobayashii]GCE24196.1 hypothetical protein KDK_79960 [Dictyobacter kobayashii]